MALSDKLITEVLSLPAPERAQLANRLLESLREDEAADTVEAAWAAEVERRAQQVLGGQIEMRDGEEVLQKARERLQSRSR